MKLFDDYHLEIAADYQKFIDFFLKNQEYLFDKDINLNLAALLTKEEINNTARLKGNLGTPYELQLYILDKQERIGWVWGIQTDRETFYMMNTEIFPPYQNKGLYKSILPKAL